MFIKIKNNLKLESAWRHSDSARKGVVTIDPPAEETGVIELVPEAAPESWIIGTQIDYSPASNIGSGDYPGFATEAAFGGEYRIASVGEEYEEHEADTGGAFTNERYDRETDLAEQRAAFLRYLPDELDKNAGWHVALRGGKIIDRDRAYITLARRVYRKHQHESQGVVLIQEVKEQEKTVVTLGPG